MDNIQINFANSNTYSTSKRTSTRRSYISTSNRARQQDSIAFSQQKQKRKRNILLGTIGAAAIGVIAFVASKGKAAKIKNNKNLSADGMKYLENLARGLSTHTGKKISADKLQSVMTKEEFTTALKGMNEQNYVASAENIEKGIFKADLHSHSIFSDGAGTVENILDNVSKYADKLHSKTKEKFIYALTDHDEIDGVKKALEIIADKPEKFKNVRFVTGIEVSYAHPSKNKDIPSATSELLVHCIDPFSENVNKFCTNIKNKRTNMISNFLYDAKKIHPDVNFSLEEAQKVGFLKPTNLMNKQWQAFHYVETKRGVAQVAKEQGRNPEELYAEVMSKLPSDLPSDKKHLHALQERMLIRGGFNEDNHLKYDICIGKYSPKMNNGEVVSALAENTFKEVIDTFSKEKDIFMSFAHPACTAENIKNTSGDYDVNALNGFLNKLVQKSKGLIQGAETYHQAYKDHYKAISSEVNSPLQNEGLLDLGGRDSHEPNWMDI